MNNNTKERICIVEGCGQKHDAKGYCRKHYYRWKTYGDPLEVRQIHGKYNSCTFEGCTNKHFSKGYCQKHYKRLQVHGNPSITLNEHGKYKECIVSGCNGKPRRKGFCPKHSSREFRHGNPHKVLRVKNRKKCIIEGCENKPYRRVSKKVNRLEKYCREHLYTNEEHKANNHKRRARKRNAFINDFTKKDWEECLEKFENSCAYCGNRARIQIEHVVPLAMQGVHSKENIIPACRSCNTSKQDVLFEEWYPRQLFYDREREQKIYKWMNYKMKSNKIQLQLF